MARKNNWFFNKSLIDEIKEFTNDEIEQEQLELEDQSKENDYLKQQLNLAIQRQEDYLADNKRLTKELEVLKETHSKRLQSQKMTDQENNEKQKQETAQLMEELSTFQNQEQEWKKHSEEEKRKLQQATETIKAQQTKLVILNEQLEKLNFEKKEPREAYRKLSETCEKQKVALFEAENQLKKVKKQHFESVQRYTSVIQQVNRLNEEKSELRDQLKQNVIESKHLEERLVSMEENQAQINSEKKTLDEQHRKEIAELSGALQEAQDKINRLEVELSTSDDKGELVEKNAELLIHLAEKENEVVELKEKIQQIEEQNSVDGESELTKELTDKVEDLASSYERIQLEKAEITRRLKTTEEVLHQKNQQLQHFEELLVKQAEETSFSPDELLQAKQKIDELTEKNKKLKEESTQSQLEIGEVLFSAKKRANRTIEEAQSEAKRLIDEAELEVEAIGNRARKILLEVSESKENVLEIYIDLEQKVEQLAKGPLLSSKQD